MFYLSQLVVFAFATEKIGRKQIHLIAVNKVSTDPITIFLYTESSANHSACSSGERFKHFYVSDI